MFRLKGRNSWVMLLFIWVFILVSASVTVAGEKATVANRVRLETSLGVMVIELNSQKAPVTCANFMRYVRKGFYDGTIFHRVMPDFMIQGGGFTSNMRKKPTAPSIRNEWTNGLKNKRGTIAMARLGRRPDSATCQFFINVQDNPGLDQPRDGAGYAVFGHVVEGLDVVDKIKAVRTVSRGGHQNVPVEPVVIEKVVVVENAVQDDDSNNPETR